MTKRKNTDFPNSGPDTEILENPKKIKFCPNEKPPDTDLDEILELIARGKLQGKNKCFQGNSNN